MPSSTETYLRDSFTARKHGWGVCGQLKRRGGPTTTLAGVHLTPTCAYHTHTHTPHSKIILHEPPHNEGQQNSIFDSSADNQIDFAVAALSPWHHALLEVTGRTDSRGGGGWKPDSKREVGPFFTTESWVAPDRAAASSYFLALLTSGLLFPLIRVQCSGVMGIRARRKSPKRRARETLNR